MTLREIERPNWQTYFDRVSAALGTVTVEIEAAGLSLGDQVEAEWLPLVGLSYEPANDVFAVMTEDLQHVVRHPKRIHVEHDTEGLRSVEVIDNEGVHHYVRLREALRLPAP